MNFKTENFDYQLPSELIAHEPATKRTDSKLMVVNKKENTISHHTFSEIDNWISKDDNLILNDTKVINARLNGKRQTGGSIEIFLLEKHHDYWIALIKNVKKLHEEEIIMINQEFSCQLKTKHHKDGQHLIKLIHNDKTDYDILEKYGEIPLPPYIEHASKSTANKFKERYQTTYAKSPGAVAAPTAGLHFSEDILTQIKKKAQINYITLHVGYGTFKPIQTAYLKDHDIHKEVIHIPQETAAAVHLAKKNKKQIIAVGTTVTRALETAYNNNILTTGSQDSKLFIYPGYQFKCIDMMVTNFHLPKSSLFVLVSTLGGIELMRKAYNEAIKHNYRFYSFGDAMLIIT